MKSAETPQGRPPDPHGQLRRKFQAAGNEFLLEDGYKPDSALVEVATALKLFWGIEKSPITTKEEIYRENNPAQEPEKKPEKKPKKKVKKKVKKPTQ